MAAGNSQHKLDTPYGRDYYNQVNLGRSSYWTNQGASPWPQASGSDSSHTIKVAAMDNLQDTSTSPPRDRLAAYTERGPAVTIAAPGSKIVSATTRTAEGAEPYPWGTQAQSQEFKSLTLQGSSMAAPQVTGVIALYLETNPQATQGAVHAWLTSVSTTGLYNQAASTAQTESWDQLYMLRGQPDRILYSPWTWKP
jgi:subtilisin family serine protease